MTLSPPLRRCGECARSMALSLALAAGALIATGCAKPQAKTLPPPPPPLPLNVPTPPPPHIVPVIVEVVETPPATIDPATATPPPTTKPAVSKPPTPPPATPPATTPPPDPPVLQTTRAPDELETRARADLIRTDQILAKIDVNRLPREARDLHEQVMRFKRLAEGDLRDKNFASAASNAEKAFTFAQALTKTPHLRQALAALAAPVARLSV